MRAGNARRVDEKQLHELPNAATTGNPTVESLQRVIDALDQFEGVPPRAAAAAVIADVTPDQEADPDQRRIIPVEEA